MECTHDVYLGTCNGRAGTTAREYALRYLGPCYPEADGRRSVSVRQQVFTPTHTSQ
jgi:hypothetical protein